MKSKDYFYLFLLIALISFILWMTSSFDPITSWSASLDRAFSLPFLRQALEHLSFHYGGFKVSVVNMGHGGFLAFVLGKFIYFLSFTCLAYSSFRLIRRQSKKEWQAWLLTFLLSVGFASFLEWVEVLIPGQAPLLDDFILHLVAILVGLLLAKLRQGRNFKG